MCPIQFQILTNLWFHSLTTLRAKESFLYWRRIIFLHTQLTSCFFIDLGIKSLFANSLDLDIVLKPITFKVHVQPKCFLGCFGLSRECNSNKDMNVSLYWSRRKLETLPDVYFWLFLNYRFSLISSLLKPMSAAQKVIVNIFNRALEEVKIKKEFYPFSTSHKTRKKVFWKRFSSFYISQYFTSFYS